MASDLRISFEGEPSRRGPGSENSPTQGSAIQEDKGIPEFPSTQLNLLRDSNNSSARHELQRLYHLFHSWLQPEKHSKDEIISHLVLEQFMINGTCSDRSTLQEKWNASGRNLEKLMEDLTDDGMKTPGLVSRGSKHRVRGMGVLEISSLLELPGNRERRVITDSNQASFTGPCSHAGTGSPLL